MDPRMERVIRYVEGDLKPTDRAAFEAEVLADPALRADVEAARRTIGGLRTLGEERLRSELMAADAEGDTHGTSAIARWWWAAAAVLVIGPLTWWLLPSRSTPQELAEEFRLIEPGLPVLMGSEGSRMDAIMNAYKQDDLDASERLIEQALMATPGNDTLTYFAGVIAMRNGDYGIADREFSGVGETSIFRDRARYQRAILSLRQGDVDAARSRLGNLAQSEDPHVSKRARGLLKRL
ncbi:MAG: hypothetical protein GFGODING_02885 [Flavobacteriales bacterium]|nr:hypothetical protein [Flavobacteriales bacterium]